jgi:hypothetical protein
MEPNDDLPLRIARVAGHVLSPRSVHAPAALVRLAPLALITVALAVAASALHGATGARAMSTSVAVVAAPAAALPGPTAPVHLHFSHVRKRLNTLEGRTVDIFGGLRPAVAHQLVRLEARYGDRWHTVARTHTGARGHFSLRFVPGQATTEALRLSARHATRGIGLLNVYREVVASYYGGGGSLACGGQLTSSTLGVANKTLPCGTLVTLRYGGRSVRVPVIDRGPFVPGREFDLTEATKAALGFPGLGAVWSNR